MLGRRGGLWPEQEASPTPASLQHTQAAPGFGFSHSAETELVYPQQGKEEGSGTASRILIGALAREGWEQKAHSSWALKRHPC